MSKTTTARAALDLAEVDPATIGRDELRTLQLRRLQWTVRHAYENVPLYRAKFDAAGVAPDDIRSLDDLRLLPFTTKDDLRSTYPFGMFAVPMSEVRRIHASSGTTGRPTVVGYTQGDLDRWADLVGRSLRAAGCRPAGRCTTRTATDCSREASARTPGSSGSARR